MAAATLPHITYLFLPTLGPLEIGILFIIVLILFGPGKLPDVFKALGDGVKQFKKASKDVTEELTGTASSDKDNSSSKAKSS